MRQSSKLASTYPTLVLTPRVRRAAVRGVLTTTELLVELQGVAHPVPLLGVAAAPAWRRIRRIAGDVAMLGLAAVSGLLPLA